MTPVDRAILALNSVANYLRKTRTETALYLLREVEETLHELARSKQ